MSNRIHASLKLIGTGFVLWATTAALAQATTLTPTATYSGDLSWQDIAGVSYTYDDLNHDHRLDVGDKVTFTVDMHKTYWGTHDFDALKVWIDNSNGNNLFTHHYTWDFAKKNSDGNKYSYMPWTKGDKTFSFSYTFTKAGTYDLTTSVMCSRDLSGLSGGKADDKPTAADWNAWAENTHEWYTSHKYWIQGQTKIFEVSIPAVPEPETYAMLIAGFGLIGTIVRRRKTL